MAVEFSNGNAGKGALHRAKTQRFWWSTIAPRSGSFTGGGQKDEISRRVCDDLSEMTWQLRAPILTCWYSSPVGRDVPDTVYWYGERPDFGDPSPLAARSSSHLPLVVEDPRTACPANEELARAGTLIMKHSMMSRLEPSDEVETLSKEEFERLCTDTRQGKSKT